MAIAWVSCLQARAEGAEARMSLGNVSLSPGKAQVTDKGRKGGAGTVLFVSGVSRGQDNHL